jgi:hypothetical protein
MRRLIPLAAFALPSVATASVLVNQQPVSGGGIARWSQLWQDPGPNGNDLDGDSVCWEDFTLAAPTTINHIEWWGVGACELGFRIQIWKQDPGTVAYQPIGVFYYGGNHSVRPDVTFDATAFTTTPGPGGINHYVLDLSTPFTLAANDATNPRWFIAIIGLTHQAYYTWNWSQGTGGSTQTFQFIRQSSGPQFRRLGEGRALEMEGTAQGGPCYANCDNSTVAPVLNVNDFVCFQNRFAAGDSYANCDNSTTPPVLNVNDFVCFQARFAAGCP